MPHINLNKVYLDYPVIGVDQKSLKKTLINSVGGSLESRASSLSVRVLNGISYQFIPGDRYVIYGKNGAGKTTLLRVLSKVLTPTLGSVDISGKVASLLDISLGMEMDSTGYENIISRGVLMGYSISEIKKIIDDAIDFTELGNFINLPLHTYSSGMKMRLGFAVSTALPADIIVMDEWLSVGDEEFQVKAEKRLRNYISEDAILIVASHDKELASKLNAKSLFMEQGKIV